MANILDSNPIHADTAATIIDDADGVLVQSMQWIDDSGSPVTAADDLEFSINGAPNVNLLCTIALCEMWLVHLRTPIKVYELIITKIDGGSLLIWTC